jgi:hypothetical protein
MATSNGMSDIFVSRWSADGELVWLTTGGGSLDVMATAVLNDDGGPVVLLCELAGEGV